MTLPLSQSPSQWYVRMQWRGWGGARFGSSPPRSPFALQVQNATLSAYGFVAKQPDGSITVAFRGSSNLRNWIANVDFVKKPYPGCAGCEVHGGFQDIYTEVSAQMLRAIDSYGGKSVTAIHLTGHR